MNIPIIGSMVNYFELALSAATAVIAVESSIKQPTVSGAELAADIAPVIGSVQNTFPMIKINQQKVNACCDAVADALNGWKPAS